MMGHYLWPLLFVVFFMIKARSSWLCVDALGSRVVLEYEGYRRFGPHFPHHVATFARVRFVIVRHGLLESKMSEGRSSLNVWSPGSAVASQLSDISKDAPWLMVLQTVTNVQSQHAS